MSKKKGGKRLTKKQVVEMLQTFFRNIPMRYILSNRYSVP